MAQSDLERTLFKADGNGIEIFGTSLRRYTATSWVWDAVQIEAKPVSQDVERLIQSDIDAGQDERIDHVLVSPLVFSILFVEGKITLAQMEKAIENSYGMYVEVEGVELLGRSFRVRTMPEDVIKDRYGRKLRFATIDSDGQIIL